MSGETDMDAFGISPEMHGQICKMVRRSASLAIDDAKRAQIRNTDGQPLANPLDAAILIYTDCPCTAAHLYRQSDLAEVCGVSQIEGLACIDGGKFPPASFEAERADPEMPRIAAMFFFAEGKKCPRCRKVSRETDNAGLCLRCSAIIGCP